MNEDQIRMLIGDSHQGPIDCCCCARAWIGKRQRQTEAIRGGYCIADCQLENARSDFLYFVRRSVGTLLFISVVKPAEDGRTLNLEKLIVQAPSFDDITSLDPYET